MSDDADKLGALREALDGIDRTLVEALAQRQRVVREVAALKLARPVALRDRPREEALLARLTAIADDVGGDPLLVTRVYQEILASSVRWQRQRLAEQGKEVAPELVVAIQGRPGSYSDQAARRHFADATATVRYQGHDSFRSLLEAVREGRATHGLLPIENTTAGSIAEAYDLLAAMDLYIVGEEVQPVEHCLIGLPGATVDELTSVWSHPQALLQCGRFLASLRGCTPRSWTDTAGSCERIAAEGDPTQGAIASELAAELHGLVVLQRAVADQAANFTRMVVVAAQPERFDQRIACKTSLLFATRHEHGALLRALRCFDHHELSLSQLQSRPRPHAPFEYLFMVDLEGNLDDPAVAAAIDELGHHTSHLRVLGTYPAATGEAARPSRPRRSAPSRPTATVTSPRREVAVGGLVVGGDDPVWLVSAPDLLAAARAHVDRSDIVWVGPLDDVAEVRARAGQPVAAPVTAASAARAAELVDLLVVPGPQMADAELLRIVGALHRPVLLQRSPLATTEEWLAAAERLRQAGNRAVILAEGGVARGPGLSTPPRIDLATLVQVAQRAPVVAVADEGVARAAVAAGASGAWITLPRGGHRTVPSV